MAGNINNMKSDKTKARDGLAIVTALLYGIIGWLFGAFLGYQIVTNYLHIPGFEATIRIVATIAALGSGWFTVKISLRIWSIRNAKECKDIIASSK